MAGPWEEYAKAKAQSGGDEAGPWDDFKAPESAGPKPGQSALRGAISGLTASLDDEFTGAVGAAGRVAGYKNLGSWKPLDPGSHLEKSDAPLSADEIVNAYRENRDAIRGEQKQDFATNPKATIGGNLVGAVVSPASKLLAPQRMGPLSKLGTLAQEMKTAGLQGAAFAAGGSDADLTKGEVGQFAKDTLIGAATGAVVPPVVAGAAIGLKKGAQAAGWTGRKAFTSIFGVSEENAAKYLSNRVRINDAPELSQIKTQVDDAVLQLSKDVDSGKMSVEQAKAAHAELKTQIRNQLTDAKVDAREALRRSEDMLKESAAKVIQPLKDKRAPTALASDVVDAVDALKSQVQAKSGAAQEVLNNSGAKIDLAPVYRRIDETIDKLKSYGTDEANAIAAKLHDYKAGLMNENWANISASAAKKRLQGLDQITKYSPLAGSFDQAKNAAFKGVRSELDQSLKAGVPAYGEAMEPVAKDAALLEQASGAFGDERRAIGRLGQIATPKGALDREALAQLEQATGKPGQFTKPIDEYTRAQAILKDPQKLEEMKRALPEYASYRAAMAKLAKMRPDWTREQLEQALSKSKEARTLSMAEDALKKAQARFEPVSALTPGSTESKLKSLMRPGGSTIETRKALTALEERSGKKFSQAIDDRAVLDSFEKGNIHGSRNTLMGGIIGGLMGGIPGATVGATFGHTVMDKYGPKVGKMVLDAIGNISERPTIQTIRGLNVPPEVKAELEREFRVYMVVRNAASEGVAASRVADQPKTPDRKPASEAEVRAFAKKHNVAYDMADSVLSGRGAAPDLSAPPSAKEREAFMRRKPGR